MIFFRDTQTPAVVSINISRGGIPKHPVDSVFISTRGLEGDGHNHDKHKRPQQAVSLQDIERLEELCGEGYDLYSGATGENLTLRHVNINFMEVGTILKFSGGVILELTKVRQPCYVLDTIDPRLKRDIIGRCGFYAKVLQEGIVTKEDTLEIIKPALEFSPRAGLSV